MILLITIIVMLMMKTMLMAGVWDLFIIFFWGGGGAHIFLACFSQIFASPENLTQRGGGGGGTCLILFITRVPKFYPKIARILPELLHGNFFLGGGTVPPYTPNLIRLWLMVKKTER